MKWLNLTTLLLVIVGGIDMGFIAVMGDHTIDFIAKLFGGVNSEPARIAYGLIGLSALWQLTPLFKAFQTGQVRAEADRSIY